MSDFLNKYPYTDFHELNLDWVIERVKKLTEDWAATLEEWNSTKEQWQELYNYVHDYFDNLNVQIEINNKIDAMILDGTFQQIATPIIQAKVAADLPEVVSDQIGGTVAGQIGSTVAGQLPGVVSDQIGAAVVDPVNTWLSSHITQPTTPVVDTSLTIAGAAADAAVTGDKIRTIELEMKAASINELIKAIGETNDVYATGSKTNVIDLASDADADYSAKVEYIFLGLKNISSEYNEEYYFTPTLTSGKTYTVFAGYYNSTGQWGNSNLRVYRGGVALINFNTNGENFSSASFTSDGTEKVRVAAYDSNYRLYYLYIVETSTAFSTQFQNSLNAILASYLKYGGHVTSSNVGTLLPDLNDAPVNSYYTGYTSTLPLNCPISTVYPFIVKTYGTNGYVVLQEFTIISNKTTFGANCSGLTWKRALTGTPGSRGVYYDWNSIDYDIITTTGIKPKITVDKSATPDEPNLLYNSFYKAMKYAYSNNCDIEVKAGNYDIVDEYIAVEGQAAFDAISGVWTGVPIGNGMTVRCNAESYFTCNITSAKSPNYLTVGQWFSPILPVHNGFRLEGFNCSAVNSRYVIHDGGDNNTDVFVNHEIINCNLNIDNTELNMYNQCIGGGLTSGGIHVIIKDCIFYSVGKADGSGTVTYHNVSDTGIGATSYNTYDISGCWFRTGTISIRKHGTETPVSPVKVHDNMLRAAAQLSYEDPSDVTDNMELLAWNNTITPTP